MLLVRGETIDARLAAKGGGGADLFRRDLGEGSPPSLCVWRDGSSLTPYA
jgi:hypothetical protein